MLSEGRKCLWTKGVTQGLEQFIMSSSCFFGEFSASPNPDLQGELRKTRHVQKWHSGMWFSGGLGSGGMVELNAFKGLFQPKYLYHSADLCAACCMADAPSLFRDLAGCSLGSALLPPSLLHFLRGRRHFLGHNY